MSAQAEKPTPMRDFYTYVTQLVANMKTVRSRSGLNPSERVLEARRKKKEAESVSTTLKLMTSQLGEETEKLGEWLDNFLELHNIA